MRSEVRAQILERLRNISGHLKGVQRMVEEDVYCLDIIAQMRAIDRAVDKVNVLLLKEHLARCVLVAISGDDQERREQVLGELAALFQATVRLKERGYKEMEVSG